MDRSLDGVRGIHDGMGSEKMWVDSLAVKMWQLSQSNDTKSKNVENDWTNLAARAEEFGWPTEDKPLGRAQHVEQVDQSSWSFGKQHDAPENLAK